MPNARRKRIPATLKNTYTRICSHFVEASTQIHLPSGMPPPPLPPPVPLPDEPEWSLPRFDLRVQDLTHPGFKIFLDNVDVAAALKEATNTVCSLLYTKENPPPL